MSLISLLDASLNNGADILLSHAQFALESSEKVCLVGRNGSGKSTLLNIIEGKRELDSGRIIRENGLKIASLSQDPPLHSEDTVFSLCTRNIGKIGEALRRFYETTDPHEQSSLSQYLENNGGFEKEALIYKILNNIGLNAKSSMQSLSGGEKRKVAFAATLITEPQLLLLDEPTNHLDIKSIEWFEDFIRNFQGTVLFVTHDRYFADAIATRIVELDRGQLYSYPGSFSRYLSLREERLRKEELSNIEFDRILAKEEEWIRRGVKARLARNEGRVRDLKKLREQKANRRSRLGNVLMEANEAERSGNLVFKIDDVSICWQDGYKILEHFSAVIMRNDRIGIIGPNGCGKTTFIKTLLGIQKPAHGYIREGANLKIEYFDQYHEALNLDKSVADNVADGHSEVLINGHHKHVISYLANFLFDGKRARSPVSVLSGGEKNRLLLARLFARPSNLLVLDEPTNDLDLETLELLEEQVSSYNGTVIVISHDRNFIDAVATETWCFDREGHIETIIGGYQDVQRFYKSKEQRDSKDETPSKKDYDASSVPELKKKSEPSRKKAGLSYSQRLELERLPLKVEEMEKELALIDASFEDASLFSDDKKLKTQMQKRKDLEEKIESLYTRWESLERLDSES